MTIYLRDNMKKLQKELMEVRNVFKHLICAELCIRPKALCINLFNSNTCFQNTKVVGT